MFSRNKFKVTLSPELQQRVSDAAAALGCSSVDEFVAQALERECDRVLSNSSGDELSPEEAERIAKQLKGLGYLD